MRDLKAYVVRDFPTSIRLGSCDRREVVHFLRYDYLAYCGVTVDGQIIYEERLSSPICRTCLMVTDKEVG